MKAKKIVAIAVHNWIMSEVEMFLKKLKIICIIMDLPDKIIKIFEIIVMSDIVTLPVMLMCLILMVILFL